MKLHKRLLAGAFFATMMATTPLAMAATPGDQLIIGTSLAQIISMDPAQGVDSKTKEVLANIYDRLVWSDDTDGNAIKPQLAESWEIDETGITFKLREASFASGNPVTANDVVFSIVRLLKLQQAAAVYYTGAGYSADNIESLVSAVDDKTFRIEMTEQVIPENLLFIMAMSISSVVDSVEVQKHVAGNDYGNEWLRTNSAGSAPFVLSRWTPNDMVMLGSNDKFWGEPVALKRIIMRHVPESQTARLMLERGDIDVANAMTASDVIYFDSKEGFHVQQGRLGGFYALSMNAGHEALAIPEVREAIAYGIDYEGIGQTILGPYGRPRNVPVPEDWEGAIANPDWSFQPEKAKELLAEAGFPNGFTLTLKTISQAPRVDIATAIQANLADIGITVTIEQGNGADIVAAHRARNFDLLIPQTSTVMPNAMGSMNDFITNPDNSAEANNAGNMVWRSDWDIPELNALRDEANAERDPARRAELVTQIQEMFVDLKPAVLPMFERFEPIVLSDRVQGYTSNIWSLTRVDTVSKTD